MLSDRLGPWRDRIRRALSLLGGAGPAHRDRLAELDLRIAVTGVRGKSTTTRWLHDVFDVRGYDTYAKVTGTTPRSIYNGVEHEIQRPAQVRLYENERELATYDPDDVAVFENQGIREYTTRLVNEQYVDPDVIFLTNVREDHLGTLGRERITVARSLARAVPADTHVVNGEQDPRIQRYIERELARRDATVTHVDVPVQAQLSPGIECVYGVDAVLRAVGESPLSDRRLDAYREALTPQWTRLPSGRVYNAADVNDVQSTDLVRRSLTGATDTTIEPLVFLRRDRRGRTASFVRYLSTLSDDGIVDRAHVLGAYNHVFQRRASFPVETYDVDTHPPGAVLDVALASGNPVLIMGNTVDEYMDALRAEIDERVATVERATVPPIAVPPANGD